MTSKQETTLQPRKQSAEEKGNAKNGKTYLQTFLLKKVKVALLLFRVHALFRMHNQLNNSTAKLTQIIHIQNEQRAGLGGTHLSS